MVIAIGDPTITILVNVKSLYSTNMCLQRARDQLERPSRRIVITRRDAPQTAHAVIPNKRFV